MARTEITAIHALANNNPSPAFTLQAVDTAAGAALLWDERDDRMTILLHNEGSSEVTVTVKAGDGIAAVCDLAVPVASKSYVHLHLDSARFKRLSGNDRGKVLLTTSGAVSVAVLSIG